MSLEPYLFLSLDEACAPAAHARLLNAAGRWAVRASATSPWLAWPSAQRAEAEAAAQRACAARGRAVAVIARELESSDVRLFGDASESALLAAEPHSAAKARRLRTEADKLEAFCLVVRAASSAADQQAFAEVGRAASKALRASFGGGSITSAFAWLAGSAGKQALNSVLDGEVELAGTLSIAQIAEAVQLARKAEHLREQG